MISQSNLHVAHRQKTFETFYHAQYTSNIGNYFIFGFDCIQHTIIMKAKQLFEELQLNHFDCIIFMSLSKCQVVYMEMIMEVFTDSELDILIKSFWGTIESIRQKEGRSKKLVKVARAYEIFKQEERYLRAKREGRCESCSSEVMDSIFRKLYLLSLIILIVGQSFRSSLQLTLVLIVLVILLDALYIYLKWQGNTNSATYEARLQQGGLWTSIKSVAKWIRLRIFIKTYNGEQISGMKDQLYKNLSGQLQEEEEKQKLRQLQKKEKKFRKALRKLVEQIISVLIFMNYQLQPSHQTYEFGYKLAFLQTFSLFIYISHYQWERCWSSVSQMDPDFALLLEMREEWIKFIEMLRVSNFSPDLFRDTYHGDDSEKYKAIRAFLQLKPEQKYRLTYSIGWAMRTVSWVRFQHTFKELKRYNSDFPQDLYNKMLDPTIPNQHFSLPSVEDIFKGFLRKLEGVKTRLLNSIFEN